MKKILRFLIFTISFVFALSTVSAGSISLSSSRTTVSVGDTVAVNFKVSGAAGKVSVLSSDNSVLSGGVENFFDDTSETIYFTAKKAGTATITMRPIDVTGYDNNTINSSKSVTVKVVNKSASTSNSSNSSDRNNNEDAVDINKTYSSDNSLKSLSIDNYDLDFSKDKYEYSIDFDEDIEKINIKAQPTDENATVKGIGEIKLTDGMNVIKIIVAAENGNERTYTINANVKDLSPIKVKVNKKEYNIVKRVDQLIVPDNFSVITANIDDKEVPALYNDLTGYILVGLKDESGNVKLYIYNPNTKVYTLYNEVTFNSVKIYYTKPDSLPSGFKKTKIIVGDEKITAYTTNKKSDFYLVYGMNVATGEIGWYRYDSVENTLQRYETNDLENLSIINNKFLVTIVILSVSILMLLLFMQILMVKIKKQKSI